MTLGEENKVLRKALRQYLKGYLFSTKNYSDSFTQEIISRLEDWVLPTIVYDFYRTKSKNFSSFLEIFSLDAIFDKYPLLKKRVLLFLDQSFKEYQSVSKFSHDDNFKILGDIHPDSVTKYSDKRFVYYKNFPNYFPLIVELSATIFPELKNYFPNIELLEGWYKRTYVKVNKDGDEENVKQYYYNFGYILPLLLLLRTTDSNQENVLIDMPYPKFFDFECIFLGDVGDFEYTIGSSGIVKVEEEDRSSLTGGKGKVKSLLKPMIYGNEAEPKIKWVVQSKGRFDNIPRIFGKEVNPRDYMLHIERGWQEGAKKVLNNLDDIISIVDNIDISFRIILKATKVYRYLTLKSLYPQEYLKDPKLNKLVQELDNYPDILDVKHCGSRRYEMESMKKCQIPVFYSKLRKNDIYSPKGDIVAEHKRTPYDIWREYVSGYNERFLDMQLIILKESLV